jgi:orotidine-5'-phosphate decarboxylase
LENSSGRVTTPIVALDFPSKDRAMAARRPLDKACNFYKVGSELFTATGPAFVSKLREAWL